MRGENGAIHSLTYMTRGCLEATSMGDTAAIGECRWVRVRCRAVPQPFDDHDTRVRFAPRNAAHHARHASSTGHKINEKKNPRAEEDGKVPSSSHRSLPVVRPTNAAQLKGREVTRDDSGLSNDRSGSTDEQHTYCRSQEAARTHSPSETVVTESS